MSRIAATVFAGSLIGLVLLTSGAGAADLRGRVTLGDGRPAANEPILLGNRPVGRTDAAGVYWLNLPAGTHTLTIRGQAVQVQVLPSSTRRDVRVR